MSRTIPAALVPAILAMTAIVVASNILVQFLAGPWLTWGAFTYPFAFLVTDLTNRFQGAAAARRVVVTGFVVGLVCTLVAAGLDKTTFRIGLGSGLAFLSAQLLDVAVFNRLRQGSWWRAPLVSTLVSSTLDTVIFFSVAMSAFFTFLEPGNDVSWATGAIPLLGSGPEAPLWVSLAIADWSVKLALAIVALIPFRLIIARRMQKAV